MPELDYLEALNFHIVGIEHRTHFPHVFIIIPSSVKIHHERCIKTDNEIKLFDPMFSTVRAVLANRYLIFVLLC